MELKFASTTQALQHLANITGKRIKISSLKDGDTIYIYKEGDSLFLHIIIERNPKEKKTNIDSFMEDVNEAVGSIRYVIEELEKEFKALGMTIEDKEEVVKIETQTNTGTELRIYGAFDSRGPIDKYEDVLAISDHSGAKVVDRVKEIRR